MPLFRHLSFILFLSCAVSIMAQEAKPDTVRIAGSVAYTDGTPVDAAVVTVLQPADSSVIAYSMTDAKGRYRLAYTGRLKTVLVRVNGFNVKKTVRSVASRSQSLDIAVEEESMALREVQVKAQKLWGNRDTLNYLVSAYMKDFDRSIGDVLKQLPGISISSNGTISYQGTPINHFYVENMDVLQGRYGLAVEGIRAEDVATVQVLEHHEHVLAMQDQMPPESAAINLKLKDKAKGVWTKALHLGAGLEKKMTPPRPSPAGEGVDKNVPSNKTATGNYSSSSHAGEGRGGVCPLWDSDVNLMLFDKRRQHVLFYGTVNTGKTDTRTTQHYGSGGTLGASTFTSVLSPGGSPVGKTLRNNKHAVNSSNLTRIGETAQVNYNINYDHDTQRSNGFSQTTYRLPDTDVRIISEDISARNVTNNTQLQLSYENNAKHEFVNNQLTLAGAWKEGNGTVLSNDESIHQHAYNRNLSASNQTRWVHRTESGGGFELSSSNAVQTNPQALSVDGDMSARQEVELMRLKTDNAFRLVRSEKKNRIIAVPKFTLGLEYAGLQSMLSHPEFTFAANGDMNFLRTYISTGFSFSYRIKDARLSLNIPLSLTHTSVNNLPIPGEKTDAHDTHLFVTPTASLQWPISDNWSLNSSASFSETETSTWSRMLTAYIMGNYRSTGRSIPDLSHDKDLATSAKLSYKNIFAELFGHLSANYSRSWSDVIFGTHIGQDAHTVLETRHMPHHSDRIALRGNLRKEFAWHHLGIEANAAHSSTRSKLLLQGVATRSRYDTYDISGRLTVNIVRPLRVIYDGGYSLSRSRSETNGITFRSFSQNGKLELTIIPERLQLTATGRHTHNARLAGKKDHAFFDASLTYRTKKKHDFRLDITNLLNTHTYITRTTTDLTEYYSIHHLRPRSVMVSTYFTL